MLAPDVSVLTWMAEHRTVWARVSSPLMSAGSNVPILAALALLLAPTWSTRNAPRAAVAGVGLAVVALGVLLVYRGAHWPTDVLAGWVVGALAGWVCHCAVGWTSRRRASEAAAS